MFDLGVVARVVDADPLHAGYRFEPAFHEDFAIDAGHAPDGDFLRF
jgi:hypothetical protein